VDFFLFLKVAVSLRQKEQYDKTRIESELHKLEKLLHFPEEVAICLTNTEHRLFMSISPTQYLQHITQDLTPPPRQNEQPDESLDVPTISYLINRFHTVTVIIVIIITLFIVLLVF